MMLAVVVVILAMFSAHQIAADVPSPERPVVSGLFFGPMAFASIDSDSYLPFKEYGLPERSRERESEEEDGDGDDSELTEAAFGHPGFDRPQSSRDVVVVANRWYLGSGPDSRMPYLRC